MVQQVSTFKQQLAAEKQRQELSIQELQKRIEEAKKLPLDSEFIQGTVDGFVQVKKGDNLYEKLGAMEITIKDGVVQNIGNYVPQPRKPQATAPAAPIPDSR
jgi:chaperonin cofactor prefoldin